MYYERERSGAKQYVMDPDSTKSSEGCKSLRRENLTNYYKNAPESTRTSDLRLRKQAPCNISNENTSTSESLNSNTSANPSSTLHSKTHDGDLQVVTDRGLRTMNPLTDSPKSLQNQLLTKTEPNDLACYLALLLQEYPEISQIVKVWPELPEAIRTGILAMVNAANRGQK